MSKKLENILIAKEITTPPMRVMVLEYILKQITAISLSQSGKRVSTFRQNNVVSDS